MSTMEDRLRAALKEAMKSRDPIATATIRSALGAIDNAGSVRVDDLDLPQRSGHIAGSVKGLGAGDVPRMEIDDQQLIEIVQAQVTSREGAADEYEGLGRVDQADGPVG